jgi:hypothetical protein
MDDRNRFFEELIADIRFAAAEDRGGLGWNEAVESAERGVALLRAEVERLDLMEAIEVQYKAVVMERDEARAEVTRAAEKAAVVYAKDMTWALGELDHLRAEVAALRAVLAEPSEEELIRLANVAYGAHIRPLWSWSLVVRAILADLRKRAGVGDE